VASTRDTRVFEAAVQALLSPLAGYARKNGISAARFRRIIADAARGRIKQVEPALPYEAAVRLVGRWTTDAMYTSGDRPRALPHRGTGSFASLVRTARAGSPERVLDALVGAGLVHEDRQGRLRLLQRAYVPRSGTSEKVAILGRAGGEFVRVLVHNLSSAADESFLQRVASYDNIGASSLMTLRRALRREGLRALERANTLLAARDRDRNRRAPGGRRSRVSFGVYMLEEPVGPASQKKLRRKR
jgi:hypothetical protein